MGYRVSVTRIITLRCRPSFAIQSSHRFQLVESFMLTSIKAQVSLSMSFLLKNIHPFSFLYSRHITKLLAQHSWDFSFLLQRSASILVAVPDIVYTRRRPTKTRLQTYPATPSAEPPCLREPITLVTQKTIIPLV